MARLTSARLQEYLELHEQRKALQRQAKVLNEQAAAIQADIESHVRAKGGKERAVKMAGYLLAITTKPGSVKWKDAYVDVAGPEAAEQLIAAAPRVDELTVEKL